MGKEVFVRRSYIEASAKNVFDWHSRPGAFERLSPPWEKVEVIEKTGGITNGSKVKIRVHIGPFSKVATFLHTDYKDGVQFRDVQVEGPFASWSHLHKVDPAGSLSCYLEDRIEYELPFGLLGKVFGSTFVKEKLNSLFDYRHTVTKQDIRMHSTTRGNYMNILVTGASGLIGSSLVPFLTGGGHRVCTLVRSKARSEEGEIYWNPSVGVIDRVSLEGLDAVVHLAGENIGSGRWTTQKKQKIKESRIKSTRLLCDALSQLKKPPKVLIVASAIGYYGSRGDEILREESSAGTGFLADICREWEEATAVAEKRGIRVIKLRTGVVLTPIGGALKKLLIPFQLGLGGKVGSGKQYMSWIAIDDVVGALYHSINNDSLTGAVNLIAPNPVTNFEFTKTLGQVLSRPTFMPTPAFALKMALGEMAEETVLASTRVYPAKLLRSGYEFIYPELSGALEHLLGKKTLIPNVPNGNPEGELQKRKV